MLLEVFNRAEGDAPSVDLDAEKRHGDFIRNNRALITACTDLSDGGLALAAFELAQASGVAVVLDSSDSDVLFGEDQGRYLVACSFDKAEALMIAAGQAGVPIQTVGKFSGDTVWMGQSSALLADLSDTYNATFAATFA